MYYGGVSFSGADAAEIQLLPSPQRETRHVSPSQVHAETVAEQLSEETGRFEDMLDALESEHRGHLKRIDDLQRELRAATVQLLRLAQQEEDAQTLADQCWIDAERAKAEQEWFIKALQEEHDSLRRTLHEKQEAEAIIRRTHETALAGAGPEDAEPLVVTLAAREAHLRTLEDRHVDADDLLAKHTADLAALRAEHDRLSAAAARFFGASEGEMRERQLKSDAVTAQYKHLLARCAEAEQRRAAARQAREQKAAHHAECVATSRKLEDDLQRTLAARDREAAALAQGIADAAAAAAAAASSAGGDAAAAAAVGARLDEAMMALKGVGVNVRDDYAFCGDVFEAWADAEGALEGFQVAYRYLEEYVAEAHGAQVAGERWRLAAAHEARYDEVEALLSAVKQMVVCYDMLGPVQRRRLADGDGGDAAPSVALRVVHNGAHLQRMAAENAEKFAEMVQAREARKRELEAEREARVRATLQRSRVASASSARSTRGGAGGEAPAAAAAAAAAAGAPQQQRSVSAATGASSAVSSRQKGGGGLVGRRSQSPRLAPIGRAQQ